MADKNPPSTAQEGSFDQAKLFLWVKGLETKVNNITREIDSIKNDFIRKTNELKKEFKTLNVDLLEFKRDHEKTVEKVDLIVKELKQTAGQEEVQTLKKYLELWNPMNFVTQRDLERTLNSKLQIKQKQVKEEKQSEEKHGPFR